MVPKCKCKNNDNKFIYQLNYIHMCQFCNTYQILYMLSCKHAGCSICLNFKNNILYSPSVKVPILIRFSPINTISEINEVITTIKPIINKLIDNLYELVLYCKHNVKLHENIDKIADIELIIINYIYLYNNTIRIKKKLNL